jgi:hypothetical protein
MTDALATAADGIGGQQGRRLEAVVAVEQARAVAQVAAQVQVAQRFPRDLDRVRVELADACRSYELAAVAFWSLPNRGQGLSVHLARELAVIWGNVDYGVHELRRDDEAHVSEVQAFCWDMQRNSKATRTFQVPHAITITDKRTRVQSRQAIIDLQDIYRNNQNAGARAMRECVFATLPRWLVDTAERLLRDTKRQGPGTPIEERRTVIVDGAKRFGITRAQLEQRVGKPVAAWTHEDVSDLEVVAQSIARGETTAAEQFDPAEARVSVDELTVPDERTKLDSMLEDNRTAPPAVGRRSGPLQAPLYPGGDDSPAAPAEPSQVTEPVGDDRPATPKQVGLMISRLRDHDVESDEDQRAWLSRELLREVTSRKDLTRGDMHRVMQVLDVLDEECGTPPGGDQ